MDEQAKPKLGDVCHRCLQPVPPTARRCPHCGDPLQGKGNMRMLLVTIAVLLTLVIGVWAVMEMRHGAGEAAATDDQPYVAPPEKKPALGQ